MRASKTHFEQIPVETVKKIAKESPDTNEVQSYSVSAETRDEVTSPQEHWRKVAKQAQNEQDPNKLLELVEELIAEFDEQIRKRPGSVGTPRP